MKKITIATVEKLLKAAGKKHDAQQAKTAKEAAKFKRIHTIRPFDNTLGYSGMKWMPRAKVFKGCNGKAVLNPIELQATSYGWWTFVTIIKGKVVFNAHNYSMTTCGHQNSVRALLRKLGVKIDLEVNVRESLSRHTFETKALESKYESLYCLEIAMQRKGSNPKTNKERAKHVQGILKDIKAARALGAKFTREQMTSLKERLVKNEASRVEKMKVEAIRRNELNRQAKSVLNNAFSDGSEKPLAVVDAETETALNNAFES